MIEAVLYSDPALREPGVFVNEIDGEVREVRDLMVETLESYGDHGAAIAANQVGFALAMFVYWDLDTHEPMTVINPHLHVHHDRGKWDYTEAEAKKQKAIYLIQGTIAPDWIESGGGSRETIKSHHNVGGLPKDLALDGPHALDRDVRQDDSPGEADDPAGKVAEVRWVHHA